MEKGIKSYIVFTTRAYRLVLFVLLPLAVIGIQLGLSVMCGHLEEWKGDIEDIVYVADLAMAVASSFIMAAEVHVDNWVFGGVAAKTGASPEYPKSSPRGRQSMRGALRLNSIRQILESALLLVLGRTCWAVAAGGFSELFAPGGLAFVAAVLFCECFTVTAALSVVRRYDNYHVNMSIAWLACFILVWLLILCRMFSHVMCAVMALLYVSASVLSQRMTMNRVEESYYDQKPETWN